MSAYSFAIKQEAVRKTLQRRRGCTIAQMADELNVPYHSLRKWLQDFKMSKPTVSEPTKKRATQYSSEQRLQSNVYICGCRQQFAAVVQTRTR